MIGAGQSASRALRPGLGRKLEAQLKSMVVTLRLGATARDLKQMDAPFAGRVEMSGGAPVELRPSSHPNVFALGDAIAAGDGMTIVAIMRQQPWLTKTIKAVQAGKKAESLARYTPWPSPPILIPLGAKKGASVLPLTRKGVAVGPFLTSAIKGRELFIPRYRKEFGRR